MKIKPSEQGAMKNNPIFDGLSDDLKDVKGFKKIEKDILKIMFSDHVHRKVKSFVNCKRCKPKMKKRTEYIKEKGFKDYHQYLSWRKVMTIIDKGEDFKL